MHAVVGVALPRSGLGRAPSAEEVAVAEDDTRSDPDGMGHDEAPGADDASEADADDAATEAARRARARADAAAAMLAGARVGGAAVARGATWLAGRVSAAYQAVDPSLRRHIAHAPIAGLTMLTGSSEAPSARPADGFRPVLFVHGLAGHPGNFGPMRTYFRLLGRTRTWSFGLPSGARVPEMAEALHEYIEALARANGLDGDGAFDIVAHSMGGLVTRHALREQAFRRRVSAVVTLGTPHGGTWAARYAATQLTLDLRPGSAVIESSAAEVPWPRAPDYPRLVAAWSRDDVLLIPHETGAVPGAENIETPGFSHLSFLVDPRAWDFAWSALLGTTGVPGGALSRRSDEDAAADG